MKLNIYTNKLILTLLFVQNIEQTLKSAVIHLLIETLSVKQKVIRR